MNEPFPTYAGIDHGIILPTRTNARSIGQCWPVRPASAVIVLRPGQLQDGGLALSGLMDD